MSEYILDEFMHAGMTVQICRDEDPVHPRKDYDHMSVIAHWHSKYDLGKSIDSGMTEETLREYFPDIIACLPLYLYDHSGITINTTGFSCKWDSGQVGWVYITSSDAKKMGCSDYSEEKLHEAIRAEVSEYDSYLTGEVYGYRVLSPDGEEADACWGFIGSMESARAEACVSAENI